MSECVVVVIGNWHNDSTTGVGVWCKTCEIYLAQHEDELTVQQVAAVTLPHWQAPTAPQRGAQTMSSKAASAQYGVTCPKCGAAPREACRTMQGYGRVTDTHVARIIEAGRTRL